MAEPSSRTLAKCGTLVLGGMFLATLLLLASGPGRARAAGPAAGTTAARKVVVLFQGIRSGLLCDASGNCQPSNGANTPDPTVFATLRSALVANGFSATTDILWYSYTGGSVDPASGRWLGTSYYCQNTAQDYGVDLSLMRSMLQEYANANSNVEFYLVGHSQGGLIAFQDLGYLSDLTNGASVQEIITLDAPLGGVPWGQDFFGRFFTCWGNPAAQELLGLYITATNHAAQGDTAIPLCCPSEDNFQLVQNAAVSVYTFGNRQDGVYNPNACPTIPNLFTDDVGTQVVTSAATGTRGLGNYYGNHSPNPVTCITQSHDIVMNTLGAPIANQLIGLQLPQ